MGKVSHFIAYNQMNREKISWLALNGTLCLVKKGIFLIFFELMVQGFRNFTFYKRTIIST